MKVLLPLEAVNEMHTQNEEWEFFVGYSIMDQHGEILGVIREVDNTTINVLFVVQNDETELLIPATEDFIVAVDEENKLLEMYLPEGLTDE